MVSNEEIQRKLEAKRKGITLPEDEISEDLRKKAMAFWVKLNQFNHERDPTRF